MTSSAELDIRLRRADFNRALADGNLAVIGPLLAQNAILVTGTDSAVIAGRKAQLLAWKREFSAPAPTRYERIAETVIASPVEPVAMEYGQWRGLDAATGEPLASGNYSAKWRRIGADWVIETEIYVTLA